ncbi:glutathione S-transferase family protein [Piscinibacter gummiphilus]|uniref:Uncharacterized protein n=1 Tax=Piscinibacter gummiphilus TaxID=946333 RepID=A0A1W6LGJ0_9BURK|nr:glutathione S-transferase N-terminal domain-containing protein [Piscinibacter gummiphilus]ARN23375.1 hypothetical protein A4W93_27655 [Piscinibacter gummiphilus]ATU68078.1 glutathione S-transferase [Piscinibacter gummiphilus]GLS97382.1 hypothetical protein GCM10007918_46740 [Piscinibacter gummiphilus]
MKLFYMTGAGSLASHVALEWAGADYEAVALRRSELQAPAFLGINPMGTVPVLADGDLRLTESIAILAFIADRHPRARLWGGDGSGARAQTLQWLAFLNAEVHKAYGPVFYPERHGFGLVPDTLVADAGRERVRELLQRVDVQLDGREWLTGERTCADAYLFVMLRWALTTKVGLSGFRNLGTYLRRLHDDAGVRRALSMEAGPRPVVPASPAAAVALVGEVVGPVEYREGEGMAMEIRLGDVQILAGEVDVVLTWSDEHYRGQAAMPVENFSRYVSAGAIRL